MNTHNNKRKKESIFKIEKIFIELIQTKEINEISVTDICKKAKLNRSTFYANYLDIYDLADKVKESLEQEVANLYKDANEENNFTNYNFLKLLQYVFFQH